ncbi:MAG: 2-dehydropantoate 2-reductase, partial [Candidatus Omnitrophica bacterium]|nr:2-dehydropantoate 2-reductase [Candidatus Omnitrophota bacterium]
AIGTLWAAYLSKSKEEIIGVVARKDSAQLLRERGIHIEGLAGTWPQKIKVTADVKEVGPVDVLLLCVKSYATKDAMLCAKPLVNDDTVVVTLQNGIGNIEMISEIVGSEKVIGGVTSMGSTLLDTGRVRLAGKGETVIGFLDGKTPVEIRTVRELFNKVGLETKITRDIKAVLWSKLAVNVGINALTALTHLPNGKLIEFEGTRKILRSAVTEAIRVAKRKRIKLIFDDPLAKVEAVCEATAANCSSMLQDVLRKKRTEIDFINGVIVRQGQELGIPVPVNAMLVDLIKTIESSYEVSVFSGCSRPS